MLMEKDIERNIVKMFARKSERLDEFAGKDVSHFWKEAQLSGHRNYHCVKYRNFT